MKIATSAILAVALSASAQVFAQSRLIAIDEPDRSVISRLLESGLDVWAIEPELQLALHSQIEEARFAAFGLDHRVLHSDLQAHYRERLQLDGASLSTGLPSGMGGYPTFAEALSFLDQLATAHPQHMDGAITFGLSHEQRPLKAWRIGPRDGLARPVIVIDALHHGREPMSLVALLEFTRRLVEATPTDRETYALKTSREIWVVPCINPDGYVHNESTNPQGGGLWRKNRRPTGSGEIGVDLNRNYSAFFAFDEQGSSGDPASESYRGPFAFSEPCTTAYAAFLTKLRPDGVLSLHSYGPAFGTPPGHQFGARPAAARVPLYERLLEHQRQLGQDVATGWLPEVLPRANGTTPDWVELALNGGGRTFAGLLEIGDATDGFWPSPARIRPLAERAAERIARFAQSVGPEIGLRIASRRAITATGAVLPERVDIALAIQNSGLLPSGPVDLRADAQLGLDAWTMPLRSIAPLGPFDTVALDGISIPVPTSGRSGQHFATTLFLEGPAAGSTAVDASGPLGAERTLILADSFEGSTTWTVGAPTDTALRQDQGQWTCDDPVGTAVPGVPGAWNPEDDATPGPGRRCWFTGQGGVGESHTRHDVDGITTVTSPRLDLSHFVGLEFEWARWFASNGIDDGLFIQASDDDGQTWITLESVHSRSNQWSKSFVAIDEHLVPSDRWRLRLVAKDDPNNGSVEAAFDDLVISGIPNAVRLEVLSAAQPSASIEAPLFPNTSFVLAAALDLGPAEPWAGGRVPLAMDALFVASLSALGPFSSFMGTLDAQGRATIALPTLPPGAALPQIWLAAAVLDGTSPLATSGARAF